MEKDFKKGSKKDLIGVIDLLTDDIVNLQKEKQQLREENKKLKKLKDKVIYEQLESAIKDIIEKVLKEKLKEND